MEMDKMQVVWKNQKELRCGYNGKLSLAANSKDGSPAMLFSGRSHRYLYDTEGIELYLEVERSREKMGQVSCAIQKDSGDSRM